MLSSTHRFCRSSQSLPPLLSRRLLAPTVLVGLLAAAQRAEAEVLPFHFLTSQSHIAVTPGGESIPGIFDDCVPGPGLCELSIEGSLSLDIDFVARTASFVDVNAALVGEGLFNGHDLIDLLTGNSEVSGTLIDDTTIHFKRRNDSAAYVVEFTDTTLHLTGGYDDTAFDGNGVAIDAFAVPEPSSCVTALAGLLLLGLHGLFRRKRSK